MYVSCHSGYGKPDMVHIHAIAVPGFPEAIIVSYALILLHLWVAGRLFWHGILTKQNNYRTINAVIARFYRLGRIIDIMGHVSILQQSMVHYHSTSWRELRIPM